MDKIKDLLKQLGASDQLSKAIISEMLSWRKREKATLQEDFKGRLEKAKEICLEEFQNEKSQLSRKIEVFLEAHVSKIEREAKRQAAIGESASAKTLRDMKCLLEGVPVDGATKELQAVKETEKRLRVRLDRSLQETTEAKASAKRANTIAVRALERNKILEGQGKGRAKPPVSEGKGQGKAKPKQRLESLRSEGSTPKTTRKVLTESQVPAKQSGMQKGDPDIVKIADTVDDTPAFLNS